MAYPLKLKQRKTMKKIILAAILFLPFLVSCSQNRKAPDVSPQTAVGNTRLIRMNGYSPVPVLPSSISTPPGVVLVR